MKTTWKVLAVMVLAIFTLSIVPLALAEGGNGSGPREEKEMKEKFKEQKEKIKEQVKEIRENRMEWLKEKGEEIKQAYEFKKQELEGLKEKSSACKANNSTECKAKKLELKKGVQQHLAKTIELIENSYARTVEKINASTGLTEEQKQSLLTQVADLQAKLNEQKDKVLAMSENSTNQEFRDAIKELKSVWQDTKKMEHRLMASLVNSRMNNIAEKHLEFYDAMTTRIAYLEGKDVEVSELKTLAERFKQLSEQLDADRKAAEAAWVAAADRENLDAAKAATEKVKEDLKQTRETLRQFLEKFKELNKDIKSADKETEVENESVNSTEASA